MMYIRAYIILATLYVQDKKISVQILKLKRNILDLVKCVFLLRLRPIFLFIVTTSARCFFRLKSVLFAERKSLFLADGLDKEVWILCDGDCVY